ncbi:MAG: hypothetical protein ACOCRO_01900 [Halanaerobiales bacterium]
MNRQEILDKGYGYDEEKKMYYSDYTDDFGETHRTWLTKEDIADFEEGFQVRLSDELKELLSE